MDADMMIELIKHGKEEFRVPLFTSLCDELSNALNVNGLDSVRFKQCLDRLVFVTLF